MKLFVKGNSFVNLTEICQKSVEIHIVSTMFIPKLYVLMANEYITTNINDGGDVCRRADSDWVLAY